MKKKELKINITEQTTTFNCPRVHLADALLENDGMSWETTLGQFENTELTRAWILANSKKSMFNNEKCFIYNKAYYEEFLFQTTGRNIFDRIRAWAKERNIYTHGDIKTQLLKLYEETGELSEAVLKEDKQETMDAIGDCVVVLTNLSEHLGVNIEECIEHAYDQIKARKGKMINGTFVKDE